MFGIGGQELIVILVIALIVLGPKKLPDLAKSLGRAMGELQRATQDLKREIDLSGQMREAENKSATPEPAETVAPARQAHDADAKSAEGAATSSEDPSAKLTQNYDPREIER